MEEAYYQGNGIYKSVDSGLSWDSLPFTATNTNGFDSDFDFIWNIKTDPSNDTLDVYMLPHMDQFIKVKMVEFLENS